MTDENNTPASADPTSTPETTATESSQLETAPVETSAVETSAVETPAVETPAAEPAPKGNGVDAPKENPTPIQLRELVDAGAHFGHQTKRWSPKMKPYIYGARNGIHIIDLDQTLNLFNKAYRFLANAVSRGGHVLFVGTKRQAADVIVEEATRSDQFYVTDRWLGGTLTNFRTVKGAIERLRDLEQRDADGELDLLQKKEAIRLRRQKDKLHKYLGGIKMMDALPAAMFVVDPSHEHIAIREARRLHIPVVALTDSNCDPSSVDFVIPGNDDSIRAIRLITSRIADACVEGAERQAANFVDQPNAGGTSAGVQVDFQRRRGAAKSAAAPQ